MRTPVLPLIAGPDGRGGFALRVPAVGIWSAHPPSGALVGPGSPAGILVRLRRRVGLVIPEGVVGRVTHDGGRDHAVPVAYGETLFRVVAVAAEVAAHDATGVVAPRDPSSTLHVVAPTDGVFYRSPSPGASPYVTAGDRVSEGRPVGLIEVMKTFNPILYGGAPLPAAAEIVAVLVADGEEVRAGQPLIAVR